MMIKKYFIILVILTLPFFLTAQTLSGMTGLLNIPSADFQSDGTFIMGANYLPAINQPIANYKPDLDAPLLGHNTGNYYFNLTFLPFLEVAYKMTFLKMGNGTINQDRAFSMRLQVIKEKEYFPSIAFGVHDAFTEVTTGNQYSGADYVVITKHFNFKDNRLSLTSGYGATFLRNNQFVGLFGGISLTPSFIKTFQLTAEYDTKGINIGGSLLFFNHLYFFSMAQRLQYYAGGIAYRIYL
ncbi:MAG: YjbH domain-containing protein [Mariniphaga sp.]